jgi:hypothetical protein
VSAASPAELARALRFLIALPGMLRHPLTAAEARATLRRRLERRDATFVSFARRAVFDVADSPYRRLFAAAGCEHGDLERLVRSDGIEATLERLARHGVFLTLDEAKGRCPVVRGSLTFTIDPRRLANPLTASHLVYRTSGSRGAGTIVSANVGYFRDRAVNVGLCLDARGGGRWRHALWVVPGGAALGVLLHHAALGLPPVAWFSQIDPESPALDRRYAWSAGLLRWTSRAAGIRLPRPVWAPIDRPQAVARWMRRCIDEGEVPHLITFPSSAAAVAGAAVEAGIGLAGARMSIGGEPITGARLAAVRAAGAEAVPHYGTSESGRIGDGCLAPATWDDIHVFHDLHAVVAADASPEGALAASSLLVTALSPTAPVVMINVSLGDEAELVRRRCGCPLDALGWTTHLQGIRSREKLTAGGMNLSDVDAIAILEEVLPARFGGDATDYQLLEQEDASGRPRLVLVVSPRVGEVSHEAVASVFLERIGAGAGVERITGLLWHDAGVISVERRLPIVGSSGKVLHYLGGRSAMSPTTRTRTRSEWPGR